MAWSGRVKAPLNSELWHSRSPANESMPLMSGKFFLPEWPVARMTWCGLNVRVSLLPSSFVLSTVIVHCFLLSSQDEDVKFVFVHTFNSRNDAYDSNQSPSLSFGVKMGHVGGKGM